MMSQSAKMILTRLLLAAALVEPFIEPFVEGASCWSGLLTKLGRTRPREVLEKESSFEPKAENERAEPTEEKRIEFVEDEAITDGKKDAVSNASNISIQEIHQPSSEENSTPRLLSIPVEQIKKIGDKFYHSPAFFLRTVRIPDAKYKLGVDMWSKFGILGQGSFGAVLKATEIEFSSPAQQEQYNLDFTSAAAANPSRICCSSKIQDEQIKMNVIPGPSRAIKILRRAKQGKKDSTALFKKEIRMVQKIIELQAEKGTHPNVVEFFHAETTTATSGHDGQHQQADEHVIVMEHIEGESLLTWKNENFLTEEQKREIMLQIFKGLKHLHDKYDVMWRDGKPQNVVVNVDKQEKVTVKIVDLGLAKQFRKGHDQQGILNLFWIS